MTDNELLDIYLDNKDDYIEIKIGFGQLTIKLEDFCRMVHLVKDTRKVSIREVERKSIGDLCRS